MKIRPAVLLLSMCLAATVAQAKHEPKDYVEGKMVDVVEDHLPQGILTSMQGGTSSELRWTYTIDSKEGVYEVREYHNGTQLFRPLDIYTGGTVMFRVNSKGRLMYVPQVRGEKVLEVLKFKPK